MDKTKSRMLVSGLLGLSFFLIANCTSLFLGLNVLAGVVQILLNAFVFVSWLKGFKESRGVLKFVAFWGVVIPVIMAGVTLTRVIIPALFT